MIVRNRHIHQNSDFVREVIKLSAEVGNGVQIGDHLLQHGTLAISATPEDFKTTTPIFIQVDGIQRTLAATDNLAFASGYTINVGTATGDFWGAFLVEATGVATPVITAKANGADQAYASEAEAIAALPAVTAGSVAIGYITVQANTDSAWTANTDDLTAASDCQAANFVDYTPGEAITSGLFDSFVPGYPFEIVGVQHFAEEVVATGTAMVRIAARDAVSAITPVTGTRGDATLSTTPANLVGTASEAINLLCTTNAAGLLEGLKVHVTIRPQGLRA